MTTGVITFLQDLVREASLSGNERGVADVLVNAMSGLGFDSIHVDAAGNVIGKRYGKKPGPTILLDAHMDNVSVGESSKWSKDPFAAEISDGKIWGRGASDTKGCLASMVWAAAQIPSNEFCGTICVTGSVMEEVMEGWGTGIVIASEKPDFVIIGEPTNCQIGIGQKGRAGIQLRIPGKSAHSSTPEMGINAVYQAVDVLGRLRTMNLPVDPFLGKGIMELIGISSQPCPPESTLPFECLMRFDRRLMPGETRESVLTDIQNVINNPEILCSYFDVNFTTYTETEFTLADFHPAWKMDRDSFLVKKAAVGVSNASLPVDLIPIPYCTNGSVSCGELGIPSIVLGPSQISLAHIIDEYIEIDELNRGVDCYTGVLKSLCAKIHL